MVGGGKSLASRKVRGGISVLNHPRVKLEMDAR